MLKCIVNFLYFISKNANFDFYEPLIIGRLFYCAIAIKNEVELKQIAADNFRGNLGIGLKKALMSIYELFIIFRSAECLLLIIVVSSKTGKREWMRCEGGIEKVRVEKRRLRKTMVNLGEFFVKYSPLYRNEKNLETAIIQ